MDTFSSNNIESSVLQRKKNNNFMVNYTSADVPIMSSQTQQQTFGSTVSNF